jgi:hypothetical protein
MLIQWPEWNIFSSHSEKDIPRYETINQTISVLLFPSDLSFILPDNQPQPRSVLSQYVKYSNKSNFQLTPTCLHINKQKLNKLGVVDLDPQIATEIRTK